MSDMLPYLVHTFGEWGLNHAGVWTKFLDIGIWFTFEDMAQRYVGL